MEFSQQKSKYNIKSKLGVGVNPRFLIKKEEANPMQCGLPHPYGVEV